MNFTSHLFASASRFWMALTASHDSSTNVSAGHVSHPPQYQPPPAAPANAATSSSPVLVNPSAGPSPSQRVYRVNGSDAVPVDSLGEDLFMGESITNFTIEKQLSPMGTTPRTCIGSSNFFQNGLRRIRYISREWNSTGGWGSEAWVYRRLFDIRGLYVSPVLGLYRHSDGRMNLCLDAPHPDFWIEASPEMPTVLKLRCATALQALHDRGVIHGGVDLCNYLIGADGRVTIINFQNSAVIHERPEGCPLPLIDAKYARLEMLKLQFKLDLLDIRPTIISLHALDALNQHFNIAERRKAKFVSGYVPKFRAISDTYIPDDQWQTRWINPTPPPRRFIMPDCTTSHLSASIQEFINLNERESVFYQMSLKEAKARLGFLPSRIPLTNGIRERLGLPVRYPLTSTSVDNTPPTSHAISLPISKKRKATTEAVGTPAPKRVRVENRRTSVTTTPAPQPSHPSRRTFPSRIPRNNKLHFRLSRDRRYRRTGEICAEEGIPHPWALIIRPDHPAWRKPEIALYIHMQQTELFSRNGHGKSCRGRSISVGTIKRGVAYCRSIYPILHFQTGHRSNSYNPDPREVPVPLVKDNRWEPRDVRPSCLVSPPSHGVLKRKAEDDGNRDDGMQRQKKRKTVDFGFGKVLTFASQRVWTERDNIRVMRRGYIPGYPIVGGGEEFDSDNEEEQHKGYMAYLAAKKDAQENGLPRPIVPEHLARRVRINEEDPARYRGPPPPIPRRKTISYPSTTLPVKAVEPSITSKALRTFTGFLGGLWS